MTEKEYAAAGFASALMIANDVMRNVFDKAPASKVDKYAEIIQFLYKETREALREAGKMINET